MYGKVGYTWSKEVGIVVLTLLCKVVLKLEKLNLKTRSKRYKMIYDRKAHLKNAKNYLQIPYKNHLIIEMWGVNKDACENNDSIKDKTLKIIEELKFNRMSDFEYRFVPHGVTAFVILKESHIAIHTWPEFEYINIDMLTCSKSIDYSKADKILEELFSPSYLEITEMIY